MHHTRKSAASDPSDETSGSTGLSGGIGGALTLKRDRGRDIAEDEELALLSDPNTAGWCIIGEATSTD